MRPFPLLLFGVFVVVHALISLILIIPGHFSGDEIMYHLMVKSFAETRELTITNGYHEFPSPELIPHPSIPYNGKLSPQYPYLFAVLAAPFYRLWGYRGLFLVNALAFPGVVALSYATAKKLLRDDALALTACLIFVLATFSWEYSQAAWPHTLFTLFTTAAFYLFIRAFDAEMTSGGIVFALTSGLVTGFAMGLRLDAAFLSPCLLLPLLFRRPPRGWQMLACCAGMLPGLGVLSMTNFIKFGTYAPLSYGGLIAVEKYLPFVWFGMSMTALAWVLSRAAVIAWMRRHLRWTLIIAGISLVAGGVICLRTFWVRAMLWNGLDGVVQTLFDLRVRGRNLYEPTLMQSRGGGIVYGDGLKKALLQSCPYLVVILLPLLQIIRRTKEARSLLLLCLMPAVFISFYAYFAWHGGAAYNLRYLLPIFPFTSILCAYAWRQLTTACHWRWNWRIILLLVCLVAGYFGVIRPVFATVDAHEFPYLRLPLIMAGILWVFLSVREGEFGAGKWGIFHKRMLPYLTLVMFLIALMWAGLTAFFYDYPLVRQTRQANLKGGQAVVNLLADDAIVFTTIPSGFFILVDHLRLRIADPLRDNFRDFPALAAFYLDRGQAVYQMFPVQEQGWQFSKKAAALDPAQFEVVVVKTFQKGDLCRIFTAETQRTQREK